ncbi:glycosyltransferase [Microcoleus sp. herbarium14]|uniref:glycosyltransferase family 2 protein n=1 Tax=Microcoleus sp. herbarium14 TaxID=3055439 RepID=UPI002FD75BA0
MLQVIIPVKNRSEIGDCVRSILVASPATKILICDGGSTDSKCLTALEDLAKIEQVDWFKYPQHDFNKSQLINQGILRATSEYLLISDADIIWNKQAISQLSSSVLSPNNFKLSLEKPLTSPSAPKFLENPIICFVQTVEESRPQAVALKRDRYTYSIQIREQIATVNIVPEVAGDRDRPGCGLICTRRQTLLSLGGYKETFTGWGWEDQDLLIRATLLGIKICKVGKVIHLSHTDATRNQHHQQRWPTQTRDRNIISCLQFLKKGELFGNLWQPKIVHPSLLEISTNFTPNYRCD